MQHFISILTLAAALLLPPLGPVAHAAVGDSLYVAADGDVTIKLLGINTSYTDSLSVYSKSGLDLSGSNPQDQWIWTPLFTSSTPVGTEIHLTGQQAGFPLVFFLRNETLAAGNFSELFRFTTGGDYDRPFYFDLGTRHDDFADVQWLPPDQANIGFTDSEPEDTTLASFIPRELADYAMSIQVSGIMAVPAPATGLLSLLGLVPLLLLSRRYRPGADAMAGPA